MTVRHATDPINCEFTLCGDAFDLDAIDGEEPPTFADVGDIVNCPKCRVVINYCKKYKRYRAPDY